MFYDEMSEKAKQAHLLLLDMQERAKGSRLYPFSASQILAAAEHFGQDKVFEALKFFASKEKDFDDILSMSDEEIEASLKEEDAGAKLRRLLEIIRPSENKVSRRKRSR